MLKVKNRARGILNADITADATSLTLQSGDGANFPSETPFRITIDDEILEVTATNGDTFTVTRGVEGTTPAAHSAGAVVELRITAGIIQELQDRTLATLGDVSISSPESGQVLKHNGENWVNSAINLGDLGDVLISSPADGEVLTYNASTGKWENKAAAGGGLDLWSDYFMFVTLFESKDGYMTSTSGSGSINIGADGIFLKTGTTANSEAELKKRTWQDWISTFSKNSKFRVRVNFSSDSNQTIWIVVGTKGSTAHHYGFKIVNNTIYGTVSDGTESTVNMGTFSAGDNITLEAVFTSGTSVEFFKNGTSYGSLTSNLPTNNSNKYILDAYITNSEAAEKQVIIARMEYLIERAANR